MKQQSEHLSNAQIEQYGKRASGAGPETEAWVETHLDDCPSCRGRVLEFQRTQFALLPDPKVNTVSSSNCPCEEDLRNLAAGLCAEPIANKLKAHASNCERCGPLLQEYIEDFSDESSPEEQAFLNRLRSSSPEWRQQKAREMLKQAALSGPIHSDTASPSPHAAQKTSSTAPPNRQDFDTHHGITFPWKWITAPAITAGCAIIALATVTGIWYVRRDTPNKAEGYLAQAYTQQRTMEARWPGAEWAPPQITLGSSESVFSKPGPLIDAEKIINDHRAASSGDSKWLRARAEAEILEGNPQSAIQLLNPAVQADPDSVPLMLDLALAYSQQFRKSRNPTDPLNAIQQLKKVLNKEPENRTALFNLALAYADNEMWDEAGKTWDRYLQIETDPKWAAEARDKRKKAQEEQDKAREKLHSALQYLSYPSDLATSFLNLDDNQIGFRLEQYQEIALRNWLRKAVENTAGPENQAVKRLALVSKRHNGDRWWGDFLNAASHHDASGVEALRAAFLDNVKGLYAEAMDKSLRAARIFKQQRNLPGELRARLESVYAQRRLLNGKNCLAPGQPAAGPTFPHQLYLAAIAARHGNRSLPELFRSTARKRYRTLPESLPGPKIKPSNCRAP